MSRVCQRASRAGFNGLPVSPLSAPRGLVVHVARARDVSETIADLGDLPSAPALDPGSRYADGDTGARACWGSKGRSCQWPPKSAHLWPLKNAHFSGAATEGAERPERGLPMESGHPS